MPFDLVEKDQMTEGNERKKNKITKCGKQEAKMNMKRSKKAIKEPLKAS